MGALPFAIEDHAITKLLVADTLTKANSEFIAGRRRSPAPR